MGLCWLVIPRSVKLVKVSQERFWLAERGPSSPALFAQHYFFRPIRERGIHERRSPVKSLPRTPLNIEHLKREATALKRQHGEGDTDICADLRHFEFSFTGRSDAEILAAPFALNDAQRITARQYGFSS